MIFKYNLKVKNHHYYTIIKILVIFTPQFILDIGFYNKISLILTDF